MPEAEEGREKGKRLGEKLVELWPVGVAFVGLAFASGVQLERLSSHEDMPSHTMQQEFNAEVIGAMNEIKSSMQLMNYKFQTIQEGVTELRERGL